MDYKGFCKAYMRTKGNMSTKDFLDNGYTMEHFIQWSQKKHDFEKDLARLIEQYERLAKDNNWVAVECLPVLRGEEV